MTTPDQMRRRARIIREAAIGFDDETARTLIELAEGVEADAAILDGAANPPNPQLTAD